MNAATTTTTVALARKLWATMTTTERRSVKRDYDAHCKICRATEIDPARPEVYLKEWLDVTRRPAIAESGAEPASREVRNYERRFEGLRGFD